MSFNESRMPNSNYPLMSQSDWDRAPWNQVDPEPIEVNCYVSYSMSRALPIMVNTYAIERDEYSQDYNFDCTDFNEEFENDEDALGIPKLLETLGELAEEKIELLQEELQLTKLPSMKRRIRNDLDFYNNVLKCSKGWDVDDMAVIKE